MDTRIGRFGRFNIFFVFLSEFGVSNALANYILLTQYHQFSQYYEFMSKGFAGSVIQSQRDQLELELQGKMKELKLTQLSQLFKALAVE